MAVSFPKDVVIRSDDTCRMTEKGTITRTVSATGMHSALLTSLRGMFRGTTLSMGNETLGNVLSAALKRNSGGYGTLTADIDITESTGDDADADPSKIALSETWTLKSVRNDMSILAYCGSGPDNPKRTHIEAWQKEPDGDLASQRRYTTTDGRVFNIEAGTFVGSDTQVTAGWPAATVDVIGKIENGIDSVMRFYPMITKKRIFSRSPDAVYEHLSEIDVPVVGSLVVTDDDGKVSVGTTRKLSVPGNMADIINGHQWLKCQDDTDALADGTFCRTESWIGAKTWDVNLYGSEGSGSDEDDETSRWQMPHTHKGS